VHCRVPRKNDSWRAPRWAGQPGTSWSSKKVASALSRKRRWDHQHVAVHCLVFRAGAAASMLDEREPDKHEWTVLTTLQLPVRTVLCVLTSVEHWHVRCGSWWRLLGARYWRGTLRSAQPWRPVRAPASPPMPSQRCATCPHPRPQPSESRPAAAAMHPSRPRRAAIVRIDNNLRSVSSFSCRQDSRLLSVGPTAGSGIARAAQRPPNERMDASASEPRAVQDEDTSRRSLLHTVHPRSAARTWGDSLSGLQWCAPACSTAWHALSSAGLLLCRPPRCQPCADWPLVQHLQPCKATWLWRTGTWSR
jgi:hypothetical protein